MTTTPAACRFCALLLMTACAGVSANPAAANAGNTTVYRCGQTYQQVPCADGQAISVSDVREPAQREAAMHTAAADQRAASELAAERRAREKALRPQTRATGIAAATAASAPVVVATAKAPHPRPSKHGKPLEASDKTLYSAPGNKKISADAKMPSP